jgi:hypothetical protein
MRGISKPKVEHDRVVVRGTQRIRLKLGRRVAQVVAAKFGFVRVDMPDGSAPHVTRQLGRSEGVVE